MKYLFILLILVSCHNRKIETVANGSSLDRGLVYLNGDSTYVYDSLHYDFRKVDTIWGFGTDTLHYTLNGRLYNILTDSAQHWPPVTSCMANTTVLHGGITPTTITVKLDTQAILKDTFFIEQILNKYCKEWSGTISANGKFTYDSTKNH